MSDASTLQEFLIGLGFKIDETGYKKFVQGIGSATKAVTKFASELALIEGAVVAAVTKVAEQFEDLYYASQRLNASVENIRGFGYAISQMGGSAAGARSALEGLASFMRSNPSGERFIASLLGVSTRDANGQLRDTTAILGDLGKRFAVMPYYIAKIRAQMLGIDERTLQAMIRGPGEFADRYHEMAQRVGVDQQQAAKAGHDFMVSLRDLGAYLQLLAEKYLLKALGPIQRVIKGLEALDRATGGASTALIALAVVLAPILMLVDPLVLAVGALAAALVFLWDDFSKWQEGSQTLINWGEWKPQIDQAKDALDTLTGALHDLAEAFGLTDAAGQEFATGQGMAMVKDTLNLITDLIGAATHNFRAYAKLLKGDLQGYKEESDKAVQYEGDLFREGPGTDPDRIRPGQKRTITEGELQHYFAPPKAGASAPPYGPGTNPGPWAPRMATAGKQALAYFMSQGWSQAQAAGIVAQGQAESGLDPRAIGDNGQARGAFQWHPDRQAAFARWSGHDLDQSTLAEQLRFVQFELTRGAYKAVGDRLGKLTSAADAGALLSRDYEKPRDVLGAMGDRARLAMEWMQRMPASTTGGPQQVVVAPHTDITVHTSDAKAAGREVAAAQGRVNADLLRNTVGALV